MKNGFTLMELLVTIAIITLVSTVFLGTRGRYTSRLALKNETYNVALLFREAQVNSMGVKGSNSGPTNFNTSYGVHLMRDNLAQVRLFTDENSNGKYDVGEQNELKNFGSGITMQKACGLDAGAESCFFGSISSFRNIYITFKRPSPSAKIRFMNPGNNDIAQLSPPAIIYLISPSGQTSSIKIDISGAVSVIGV